MARKPLKDKLEMSDEFLNFFTSYVDKCNGSGDYNFNRALNSAAWVEDLLCTLLYRLHKKKVLTKKDMNAIFYAQGWGEDDNEEG